VVTATELGLLRDQLRQWLAIFDREVPQERSSVRTDTTVIDAVLSDRGVEPTGDPDLDAGVGNWRMAWRANANWSQRAIDASVTVVDAGARGWSRIDPPPRVGDEQVDVTLEPLGLQDVIDVLG